MANLGRNGNTLDKNAYKTALNEAAEALEQAVRCMPWSRASTFSTRSTRRPTTRPAKKRVADYRAKFGMTK